MLAATILNATLALSLAAPILNTALLAHDNSYSKWDCVMSLDENRAEIMLIFKYNYHCPK